MPFSAVEEQNYQNMFDQYAASCGLDREGNPRIDNWDPRDPVTQQNMRYALDQLRQIVLRPRSGRLGRRILGRKAGPLRTLAEVLDAMIDHSDSTVRTLHRDLLSLKLTKGQVLATLHKTNDALAIWEEVLGSSTTIVADCRQQLRQEIEAARVSEEEDRSEDEASSGNDDGEIVSPRVVEARRRLRHALEIQHKAMFFCANAYYSIKSDEHMTPPESEEFRRLERLETEGYDSAKEIRKEILQESQTKARELMEKIAESASKQDFTVIPSLNSVDQKGIESSRIVDAFEMLCAVLDEQANVLDEWREHVIQLLVKPLVDEEADEITGEEYDQSTKLSEEILVYVQALKTVLADRHQILSGQSNFLIEHEYKTTIRQAGEGEGPAPEKLLELFKIRNEMKPDFDDGNELSSLRGVITALRNLSTKLQPGATSGNQRSANELAIVAGQLKLVQKQLTEQSKTTTSLEKEADLFTETMNARMEFYRQLQAVSDMVADLSREQTKETLQVICRQEENAQDALSRAQARHRYRKSHQMLGR
jgi:E3 ubiquitin-protein ligase SHPRH